MSQVFFLVDAHAGKIARSAAELATFAKRIGESVALVFDSQADAIIDQLKTLPVDKVITCAGDWEKYSVAAISDGISQLIKAKNPTAVLITSSARGKEIAGRVAVQTDSGLITDAIEIDKNRITTQSVFEIGRAHV